MENKDKNELMKKDLTFGHLGLKRNIPCAKEGTTCPIYFVNKNQDKNPEIVEVPSIFQDAIITNSNCYMFKSFVYNNPNLNYQDYILQQFVIITNKITSELKINMDNILYNGTFSFMKPLLLNPELEQETFLELFSIRISSFVSKTSIPHYDNIYDRDVYRRKLCNISDPNKYYIEAANQKMNLRSLNLFTIIDEKTHQLRPIEEEDIPYVIYDTLPVISSDLCRLTDLSVLMEKISLPKFCSIYKKILGSTSDSENYNRLQMALLREVTEDYHKIMELAELILVRNLQLFIAERKWNEGRVMNCPDLLKEYKQED